MITRLYVDNFRCLVNFNLELSPLTLLVGENGAGKSTVLDVCFALRQFLSGSTKVGDPSAFPTASRTRWQELSIQTFELDVSLSDDSFTYRLELEHDAANRRARVRYEGLTSDGKPLFAFTDGEIQLYRDNHSAGPAFPGDWSESALARVVARNDNKRLTCFLDFIRKIQVCGFYPRNFATDSTSEDPILSRDGSNFSSWYRHLLQEHQDTLQEFNDAIGKAICGLQSLRLERVGTDARALIGVFGEKASKYLLRLDEFSDGQRALLALYGLTRLAPVKGDSLLLDEPDNYVSLPEIQPWLIELADRCESGEMQAVVCSHNPDVIDYIGADRGLLLGRGASGVTVVRPLKDVALGDAMKLSEVIARGWER